MLQNIIGNFEWHFINSKNETNIFKFPLKVFWLTATNILRKTIISDNILCICVYVCMYMYKKIKDNALKKENNCQKKISKQDKSLVIKKT